MHRTFDANLAKGDEGHAGHPNRIETETGRARSVHTPSETGTWPDGRLGFARRTQIFGNRQKGGEKSWVKTKTPVVTAKAVTARAVALDRVLGAIRAARAAEASRSSILLE